jgi:hypothetical protein
MEELSSVEASKTIYQSIWLNIAERLIFCNTSLEKKFAASKNLSTVLFHES